MEEVKNLVRFVTIPNFPNYCIGEDGRVWSDNRMRYLKWYRGKGCEKPHVTLFHISKLLKLTKKDNSPRCHNCERRGTMDCPVSYMCYSTKDKPYFKSRHNGK